VVDVRILYLGNNWVGWQIAAWLRSQGEELAGLVVHPPARRRYGDELISSAGVDPSRIFDGSQLRQPAVLQSLKALRPEIAVSALFGYILRPEFLELLPAGCINVHPALLPYNRGAFPNVWSIVDGTPAGATVHYIDAGIDTGDIIAQREVPVSPTDTGESLYRKLEHACVELFTDTWPLIRSGQNPRLVQAPEAGTVHRLRDVERLDDIDLDKTYTARELIDAIRSRTFPPYAGTYIRYQGRKIYLRLQLLYEEDLDGKG
jgi:methionyl-tRNA formyltransferase